MKTHEEANCRRHNYLPQQVDDKNTKKNKGKTKRNLDRCGKNHFIGNENSDLGKNDGRGDFKPRTAKKKHPSSLMNKGLRERTEGWTVRVSKEALIENFCSNCQVTNVIS